MNGSRSLRRPCKNWPIVDGLTTLEIIILIDKVSLHNEDNTQFVTPKLICLAEKGRILIGRCS